MGAGDPTKSAGKTVDWPVGLGASGNEGVTQGIDATDGGVGYIELAYALENQIPFADVQNSRVAIWITPSLASLTTSRGPSVLSGGPSFNLANTAAPQGYPISGTT